MAFAQTQTNAQGQKITTMICGESYRIVTIEDPDRTKVEVITHQKNNPSMEMVVIKVPTGQTSVIHQPQNPAPSKWCQETNISPKGAQTAPKESTDGTDKPVYNSPWDTPWSPSPESTPCCSRVSPNASPWKIPVKA